MVFFTKQMINASEKPNASNKSNKSGKSQSKSTSKNGKEPRKRKLSGKISFSYRALEGEPEVGVGNEKMNFDQKRLLYLKQLLNRNVDAISSAPPPTVVTGQGEVRFARYSIDQTLITDVGYTKKYYAKHSDFPDMVLLAKVIKKLDSIPNKIFLKMTSFLGRKQSSIASVWDIFIKPKTMEIILITELASHRDLALYVEKSSPIPEWTCTYWLRQLHKAMDFLGDLGICHRNIAPKYILLQTEKLQIKLSHFYDSIIYWNPKADTINFCPCLPKGKQKTEDYQAPEVYGGNDAQEFDPTMADIWSLGAVMYFTTCGEYPYSVQKGCSTAGFQGLKVEIESNINKLSISIEGKLFLNSVLTPNVSKRVTFDKISRLAWLSMFKDVARSNGFI